MNYIKKNNILFLLFFVVFSSLHAQQIDTSPVKIPMLLSGNFGELRNNHFHSGIDIKIQGKIGLPLYSFDDGYISRIFVSPSGYGNALYIIHPETGYTTVYGHMDKFFDEAAKYVEDYQYSNETFRADLYLKENEIPIKKGQYIGNGGNSGSSGGPHLHFEIRDTKTEEPINPIPFLETYLADNRSPQIREIMVVPINEEGIVNGSITKKTFPLVTNKKNSGKTIDKEIIAWGKIGIAVKAYDYMDQVTNIFGPYIIKLLVDEENVFESKMDRFSFDETRYLNSFIDYSSWRRKSEFFMKSFIDPGNKLRIYRNPINNGIINIDEERDYKLTYILSDYFGNETKFSFIVKGQKSDIYYPEKPNTMKMSYDKNNKYVLDNVELYIPKGNLYTDIDFKYGIKNNMEFLSPVYTLHDYNEDPLHDYCPLKIRVEEKSMKDISKYFIARITSNNRKIYCKSEYKNGWFETKIRDFGDYTVASDFVPPVINPLKPEQWGTSGKISCKISDKDSGIKDYWAEIDGKFYLLEYDAKNSLLSTRLNNKRIQKGQKHSFHLIVTDNCGNEAEYKTTFIW
ncbi:MAG: M23 family metallopeptidase [Candidatus Azobacteroides sp.]|nr:M23 family metallopeptidase [Candidatus Azobacteroides sp.]